MKELENLKELYLEEIKKLGRKGELTPAESEAAHKALEALEIIDKLCKEEDEKEYSQNGGMSQRYSQRGYSQNDMSMNGGMSQRMMDGEYYAMAVSAPEYHTRRMPEMTPYPYMSDGYSERRGRSSTTGRYVSRHGDPVDRMIDKLEDMRTEAPDEMTRKAIERCIDKLETR